MLEVSGRSQVRATGTRAERRSYFQRALASKTHHLQQRAVLGEEYMRQHFLKGAPATIQKDVAIARMDLRSEPLFHAAFAEAVAFCRSRPPGTRPGKGSLEFVAGGSDFTEESAIVKLATAPAILGPVIEYFGYLPVLFSIGVSRAAATNVIPGSSHMLHLDPEDVSQVKVFINVTEVERDRAFYALPAFLSDRVVEETGYSIGRLPDSTVDEIVGLDRMISSEGPSGMAIACDTNRCLHFGGRPGRILREMMGLTYVLPTSTWFPMEAGDGEQRVLLDRLEPRNGNQIWNAVIGRHLV